MIVVLLICLFLIVHMVIKVSFMRLISEVILLGAKNNFFLNFKLHYEKPLQL